MVKFRNVVWLPLDAQISIDELTKKLRLPSNIIIAQIVLEYLGKDGNLKEAYIATKFCPLCNTFFQNGAEAIKHFKTHKNSEFTLKYLLSKGVEKKK